MSDSLNDRFVETMNDNYDKFIAQYVVDTNQDWTNLQDLANKIQHFDWLQEYDSFIMWFDNKREAV